MYQALGKLRHRCHGCGTCCYGHLIAILDDEEDARIRKHAATMGVEDPIVDGALRFENGRCVFHGEDLLCDIHKRFGGEEKPLRCQLWPLKVVQTENELRVGIDPGCQSTWKSFADGEAVEIPERIPVRQHPVSPGERNVEMGLLRAATAPGATISRLAHMICGTGQFDAEGLPDGFAERAIIRLQALRLQQLLDKPDLGEGFRDLLAPLPAVIDALDKDAPPEWPVLSEEAEAFAVDVFRRALYLREAPEQPVVHGLALLMITGAVLCAWTEPKLESYGPLLSTWSRLTRFRAFWLRFAPDPGILRWIATGDYQGPFSPDIVVGLKSGQ